MAESVTIARPYAEAVFRLAREGKTLAQWSDTLKLLATIAKDPEMVQCMGNPELSSEQLTQLFVSLSKGEGNQDLVGFVRVLAENDRLVLLPQIQELYEQLKGAEEGIKEAVIYSAFPLDDAQVKNLMGQLESHFQSKLQPRVVVDQALIGGVKVAVGDQVLDASVRGKLEAMATALKN
ncbi:F0F1 ATP synthase subunit delta [Azospira inquinata]|uniref:ATP synthase subunit delta n=1 Tax=Azospira inquinata TaxID=2785627 RepID=A0A975XVZ7_9RHOO|nr:F0F1 ATP synthase subunit delta [Azospira inquinata]QWT46997.1 F0F1 ATP synthase subunit delta [Azospira inquinata]QWT50372.1 F0F1 ATP synthase subunit delta [Azospira inquinata]